MTTNLPIKLKRIKIECRDAPDICIWIAGDDSLQAHISPKADIEIILPTGRRFSARTWARKRGVDTTRGLVAAIPRNAGFVALLFPRDRDIVQAEFRLRKGELIASVPPAVNIWAWLPIEERNRNLGGHVGRSWVAWDGKQPAEFRRY